MARYLGIQPIVLTKEQQEAEEKRKKEVLDKFLNSLKKNNYPPDAPLYYSCI